MYTEIKQHKTEQAEHNAKHNPNPSLEHAPNLGWGCMINPYTSVIPRKFIPNEELTSIIDIENDYKKPQSDNPGKREMAA